MELTLDKLIESGLKFNIEKYLFGQTEMELLGFWVTHNGVKQFDKNGGNKEYYTTKYP